MKTSAVGRQLIESFEGLILKAYDDYNDHVVRQGEPVHGTLTIGYGHTTSAGGLKVFIGQTITKEQADQLLAQDLVRVENDVNKLVKVPLNQNQFDALVSFHFNTGALGKSSALKKLNNKDYEGAAEALTLYVKANGNPRVAGLVRRRAAEKKLFLTPYKPSSSPAMGTVVVAGTAAATTATASGHHHTALIIVLGALFLTLVVFGAYEFYKYQKNRNVPDVK